jgi:DNA-binding transcriptional ArsR family regulator
MSLPAVMQHLQVLEACGLVRSAKVGRIRTCHVEPAVLRWALAQAPSRHGFLWAIDDTSHPAHH